MPFGNTDRGGQADEPDMFVHTAPKSVAAECCRAVRTTLAFMSPNKDLQTIAISSASPLEGKSTLAVNLAISMAQSGKQVLLIDSDLRRPRLHRVFGKSSERGVTTVIQGTSSLADAVQETEIPNLSLLASGPIPTNPSELLHTRGFARLLSEAGEENRAIILDSPPLGVVTDGTIIAPQVDGVILVARNESTTRAALRSAMRTLNDVSADIIGCVLNDVDTSRRSYGYGTGRYYYYYGKGYQSTEDAGQGTAAG
jgi:capsular exopolysaccharide synthesis family protein